MGWTSVGFNSDTRRSPHTRSTTEGNTGHANPPELCAGHKLHKEPRENFHTSPKTRKKVAEDLTGENSLCFGFADQQYEWQTGLLESGFKWNALPGAKHRKENARTCSRLSGQANTVMC